MKTILPSKWTARALLIALAWSSIAAAEEPTRAPLGERFESFVAPDDPGADDSVPQPPDPSGTLTLRDAIAAALLGNPELAVFSWDVRRGDARAIQAGLLPNPGVLVEVENLGGGGDRKSFEQTETTVWLSQLLQIGGKRGKRQRVADLERELSAWQYEQARLNVLTRTNRAFVSTLSAQARLDLVRELERIASESVSSIRAHVRAGGAPTVEAVRAEVELSRARLQQQVIQRELDVSRATLASMWGSSTPRFTEVRGDLAPVSSPPPLSELERRVEENPDVARWETEIARREASLSLERARGIPFPTINLGGRHFNDNGDMAFVFAVSVPLPVFNRNQGSVLDAASGVAQAKAEKSSARLSVLTAVRQRYAGLLAAFTAAETLQKHTLPSAKAAYRGTREGFQKGLFRYLEVLDAQRTLFELRMQRIAALSEYHLARADLERLTASPLELPASAGEAR